VAVCLAAKIVFSAVVFYRGLSVHVLTPAAAGWIAVGWFLCGLVMAGFAVLACMGAHRPEYWILAAAVGFLLVPLVDLAAAPLALAWNRHR
jgi:predicted Na+-dependent transporter